MCRFVEEVKYLKFRFINSCGEIDKMFDGEPDEYKNWAAVDEKFLDVKGMTGIYQCYCNH